MAAVLMPSSRSLCMPTPRPKASHTAAILWLARKPPQKCTSARITSTLRSRMPGASWSGPMRHMFVANGMPTAARAWLMPSSQLQGSSSHWSSKASAVRRRPMRMVVSTDQAAFGSQTSGSSGNRSRSSRSARYSSAGGKTPPLSLCTRWPLRSCSSMARSRMRLRASRPPGAGRPRTGSGRTGRRRPRRGRARRRRGAKRRSGRAPCRPHPGTPSRCPPGRAAGRSSRSRCRRHPGGAGGSPVSSGSRPRMKGLATLERLDRARAAVGLADARDALVGHRAR